VTVSDWDWNEHVVQASKAFEFGIEGVGEYNVTAGDLGDVNVWLVY
jgi:hypothetical protein